MFDFFFSSNPNQLIGTVTNIVIVVIAVCSAYELARSYAVVAADRRLLAMVERDPEPGLERTVLGSVAERLPEHHLVRRRIHLLQSMHARGADVDPDAFSALAVGELDRTLRLSRWASTTVVLLGLAGTLVGLSQAVLAAQPMLSEIAAGPEAVKAVITTFSGLGTAFATTLMGIIAAVIVGFGLGAVRSSQAAYLQQVEELSMVRLYPFFRTSPAMAMVESARLLGVLQKTLADELKEVIGQLRMQGMALTRIVEDSLNSVTVQAAKSGDGLRTDVSRTMSELQQEVRTGWLEAHEISRSSQQTLVDLVGVSTRKVRPLMKSVEALELGTASMLQCAEQLVGLAPQLQDAIGSNVDKQTAAFRTSVENVSAVLPVFADEILNRLASQEETLATTLSSAQSGIAEALNRQSAEMHSLRESSLKLKEASDSLRDRSLVDAGTAEQLRVAVESLAQQVGSLRGGVHGPAAYGGGSGSNTGGPMHRPPERPLSPPAEKDAASGRRPLSGDGTESPEPDTPPAPPPATPAPAHKAPSRSYWDRIIGRRR